MDCKTFSKVASIALFTGVAIGSACIAYRVITDDDLKASLRSRFHSVVDSTINKTALMSEEAAARTAEVTKNPEINKTWVANQWEKVGY